MQNYDFTVAPNGTVRVSSQGNYLKYRAGNAGGNDATITVQCGTSGSKFTLSPGMAITREKDFNDWTITAPNAVSAIAGTVVIGHGRIDDPTVAGVVQVVDGGKQRTLSGAAFAAYGNIPATAGVNGQIQLWNPVGSGKRIVVEAITVLSVANLTCGVSFATAALGTVVLQGQSKNTGGAASLAQVQSGTTAAGLSNTLIAFGVLANTSPTFKFNEPVVLAPGAGILVQASTVNTFMGAGFEWYEEVNQ